MAHVGQELALGDVRSLGGGARHQRLAQRARHLVEALGQVAQLVVARVLYTRVEIPAPDAGGGVAQRIDAAREAPSEGQRQKAGEQHRYENQPDAPAHGAALQSRRAGDGVVHALARASAIRSQHLSHAPVGERHGLKPLEHLLAPLLANHRPARRKAEAVIFREGVGEQVEPCRVASRLPLALHQPREELSGQEIRLGELGFLLGSDRIPHRLLEVAEDFLKVAGQLERRLILAVNAFEPGFVALAQRIRRQEQDQKQDEAGQRAEKDLLPEAETAHHMRTLTAFTPVIGACPET